jgi:hypothetical protein
MVEKKKDRRPGRDLDAEALAASAKRAPWSPVRDGPKR